MPAPRNLEALNQWMDVRCIALRTGTADQALPGSVADAWQAEVYFHGTATGSLWPCREQQTGITETDTLEIGACEVSALTTGNGHVSYPA